MATAARLLPRGSWEGEEDWVGSRHPALGCGPAGASLCRELSGSEPSLGASPGFLHVGGIGSNTGLWSGSLRPSPGATGMGCDSGPLFPFLGGLSMSRPTDHCPRL